MWDIQVCYFHRDKLFAFILLGSVVKTMVAALDLDDEEKLKSGLEELIKMYPRYRKEFRNIVDEISSVRFSSKCPVIVLFSLDDNSFKIMC